MWPTIQPVLVDAVRASAGWSTGSGARGGAVLVFVDGGDDPIGDRAPLLGGGQGPVVNYGMNLIRFRRRSAERLGAPVRGATGVDQ
ncbi:hypothetical protein SSCG_03657 [Streptomyces clavuligerus]|nr:hypothetical protein SSCG_03657 [Streptomyces clavuligerus]